MGRPELLFLAAAVGPAPRSGLLCLTQPAAARIPLFCLQNWLSASLKTGYKPGELRRGPKRASHPGEEWWGDLRRDMGPPLSHTGIPES